MKNLQGKVKFHTPAFETVMPNNNTACKKTQERITNKRKNRQNDIEITDIWLIVHMWICYCTRMQRYKKVCSAIKNSKYKLQAHEQGGALEHILLDPYNTWFYLQYTKPQLHERIRFLKSKIKQYSDDTMMKILEEGSELFPCILYKDVFTFVKNCTTAYYVSSTNYVKIKRNGNQWELHNLNEWKRPANISPLNNLFVDDATPVVDDATPVVDDATPLVDSVTANKSNASLTTPTKIILFTSLKQPILNSKTQSYSVNMKTPYIGSGSGSKYYLEILLLLTPLTLTVLSFIFL